MTDNLIEVPAFVTRETAQALAFTLSRPFDSETAKHRHLVEAYTRGNGVDLGSSGDPVVPWAIQVELPAEGYSAYNPTRPIDQSIHWRGSAIDLPFKDEMLDFVHASHLLEDFDDWHPPLAEWDRVIKPGGFLIIAVPDHERFRARVKRAMDEHGIDVDNLSHVSEHLVHVGALPDYLLADYETLLDQFVSNSLEEYSIIYAGRKR